MKMFRKNLEVYFNEPKDLSNRPTKKYNYLIHDQVKGNNFITNSYGWIRLNNNNEKDRKKIEIVKEYGENKLNSNVQAIIRYDEEQRNNCYCNVYKKIKDIQPEEVKRDGAKKLIDINGVNFDLSKIKHIANILGNDCCIFTSENEKRFINITSKNGYAFLLGCMTF